MKDVITSLKNQGYLKGYWDFRSRSLNDFSQEIPESIINTLTDAEVYYSFDSGNYSGTTVYDLSSHKRNGTANNVRVYGSAGKINLSADFTKGTDIVTAGFTPPTGNKSVSFWMKTNVKPTYQTLIMTGGALSANDNGLNVITRITTGYLECYVGNGATVVQYLTAMGNIDVTDNNWHHVVCVQSGTGGTPNLSMYLDGSLHASISSTTGAETAGGALTAGKSAGTASYTLNGFIDEVAFYNRALTTTEVSQLWNNGNGWNPYTRESGKKVMPDDKTYFTGKGLNLRNTFLNIGYNSDFSPYGDGTSDAEWTIYACMRLNQTPTEIKGIFSKGFSSGQYEYGFGINTNKKLIADMFTSTGEIVLSTTVVSSSTINVGEWTHVAAVYGYTTSDTNDYGKIYINGNLDTEVTTGSNNAMTSSVSTIEIGRKYKDITSPSDFDADFKTILFFNKALTQTELSDLQTQIDNYITWPSKTLTLTSSDVIIARTDFGVNDSTGNEGNELNGFLSNTPFQFGDDTGLWEVDTESINGEATKVIKCIRDGILFIPYNKISKTTSEAAFGSWEFWMSKGTTGTTSEIHIINDTKTAGGSNYALYYDKDNSIGMFRDSISNILFTSSTGFITINDWHKIKIERKIDPLSLGQFSAYYNNVLITANTGTNPVTDTTNMTSNYIVLNLKTDDKIAFADKSGNHSIVKKSA